MTERLKVGSFLTRAREFPGRIMREMHEEEMRALSEKANAIGITIMMNCGNLQNLTYVTGLHTNLEVTHDESQEATGIIPVGVHFDIRLVRQSFPQEDDRIARGFVIREKVVGDREVNKFFIIETKEGVNIHRTGVIGTERETPDLSSAKETLRILNEMEKVLGKKNFNT